MDACIFCGATTRKKRIYKRECYLVNDEEIFFEKTPVCDKHYCKGVYYKQRVNGKVVLVSPLDRNYTKEKFIVVYMVD